MSDLKIKKRINALLFELRARLRDVGRDIVGHWLSVRRSKSDRLVKAKKHALFTKEAPRKIAATLGDLEKQPDNREKLKLFFGLLGDFIIALNGLHL